jgi:hypothetical protein
MTLPSRALGRTGPTVSAQGLGFDVTLTADDLARLDGLTPAGDRYAQANWTNLDTPPPA